MILRREDGLATMATPPKRPGLELLIRRSGPDGTGFELKVLPADRAFLKLRPRARVEAVAEVNALDEATGRVHIVRLHEGEVHLRLTESEYGIWRRMDGKHSIQDLATAMVFEYGRYDFDEIRRCLARLRAMGLVHEHESRLLRTRGGLAGERARSLARAFAEFDHRWVEVDAGFARLHRRLRPLFSRRAPLPWALVGAAGLLAWMVARVTGTLTAAPLGPWAWALAFALALPLFMAVHEVAHGLACKANGRRVKAVGFTLHDYLLPSLYVDVTDMYMSSRRARIAVDLAGPLSNLVIASLATGVALALPPVAFRATLVLVADVNVALALFTAWPFHGFQEDGYQALSESLRTTLLRSRSWARVRALLTRQPPVLHAPAMPTAVFVFGFVLSWSAALVVLAWALWPSSPLSP